MTDWTFIDTWIVVAGALAGMSCALIGNFLVLRRLSMMGDAISHAVLPGLAVAFLITQSRSGVAMFIGAAVVGVLTALLTEWIRSLGKVEESASMGVVFTALFALGLILIVRGADAVDLDPGCVLYGAIELTPLDTVQVFGADIPRAVVTLAVSLAINVLFVGLFYKELRICAFDPALSTTLGFRSTWMHYGLMTLVAVTAVAAFESVGSILVIAMLIVPAASAHLLTDRYLTMLIISVVIGAASAVVGHVGAIALPPRFGYTDTSTAGMMAVASGLIFGLVMLVAPRHGIVSRMIHRGRLSLRIACEDILGLIYRLEEAGLARNAKAIPALLHDAVGRSRLQGRVALMDLRRRGRIRREGTTLCLTAAGRRQARSLVRAHRLWESYLAKHFKLPKDHLHESAERTEHYITPSMDDAMSRDLEHLEDDPHGRAIPKSRDVDGMNRESTAPADRLVEKNED